MRLASKLGVVVEGVEPSEFGAAQARKQGFRIFQGTLESYAAENQSIEFDLITSTHVVEHLAKPVETLSAMKNLLAARGLVVIIVARAIMNAR